MRTNIQLQKIIFIITSKKTTVLPTLFVDMKIFSTSNLIKKFDYEKKLGIFHDYYKNFDLAYKGWEKFRYETDPDQL